MEEKLIDDEAIFIDGIKIEANANKFTFVWKKSILRYSTYLIEKSNHLYEEFLAQDILPAITRKVDHYDQQIEAAKDATTRKQLRAARKEQVKNEIGFALMGVNLRKYIANIEKKFFHLPKKTLRTIQKDLPQRFLFQKAVLS